MDLQMRKNKGLELYKQGKSLSQISKEVGINRLTITKFVKESGYEVSNPARKHRYNDDYFEVINTEDKAYWLGFIYADGCINDRGKNKNLEIGLKKSDRGHLVKFVNAIGGVSDLISDKRVKLNGEEFESSRVVVCCTKMCNDLINHGATPRKSLTLAFPQSLPLNLTRHFIRGYIDGDGCIDFPNRISVVGTDNFLNGIMDYFEILGASRTKPYLKQNSKAFQYEKSGAEILLILSNLYLNANVFLDRKYKLTHAVLKRNL
jgi:hypothetical protein